MFKDSSEQDLRQAFLGSVVMINEQPSLVMNIQPDIIQSIDLLTGRETLTDDMSTVRIDNLNTGYVNSKGDTLFFLRKPCRQFKRGLTSSNCVFLDKNESEAKVRRFLILRHFNSKAIGRTVANIYPSYKKTLEALSKKGYQEIAFDRQFSITREGLLRYSTEKVGKVNMDNGNIRFMKGKSWIRKILGENYAA